MKGPALIRVDGARHIGMGHVVRCLGFAQALKSHGVESVFVIRDHEQKVVDLPGSYGFQAHIIGKDKTLQEDAVTTAQLAKTHNARFVIVDLSNEDNLAKRSDYLDFFKTFKTAGKFLIVIDDYEKVDFPFDLQVIPYCGAEHMKYKFFDDTKYLLGCSYYIVAPNLAECARRSRVIRKDGKKVLVTMGGSDPTSLTLDVAQALLSLKHQGLEVKIVIGVCFSEEINRQLRDIMKSFEGPHELCFQGSIPELMLWSDIAITGVGLTRYEAALTGTPNICITRNRLEEYANDKFISAGTSCHLSVPDKTSQNYITKEIDRLLRDFGDREKMFKTGKNLIDGKGAERIIAELRKGSLV